jgi:predicted nucleic acid-binding protein
MNWILLDTNVFSFLLPFRADTRAELYRHHVEGADTFAVISFVTVAELYVLAERRKWGPLRVLDLEAHLSAAVVVPYDVDICRTYARLKTSLRNPSGSARVVESNDLWIAACAVSRAIPLITHNRRHFEGIPGLTIISEAP